MKKLYLIIIAVILASGAFLYVKFANTNRVAILDLQRALSTEKQTAKKYKDQYGVEHAMLLQSRYSEKAGWIKYDSLLTAVAKRTGTKPNNITEVTAFEATKEGVREFDVDSFLATLPVPAIGDTTHRIAYIPIDCNIKLNYIKYWHRSWFLGNKKWFVDVYSDDKSVKINNLKSIHIADEYSPFALSVTAGVTIPNFRPVAVIGLSYTPNFLRFKKRN